MMLLKKTTTVALTTAENENCPYVQKRPWDVKASSFLSFQIANIIVFPLYGIFVNQIITMLLVK